jgi:hypothetical protein
MKSFLIFAVAVLSFAGTACQEQSTSAQGIAPATVSAPAHVDVPTSGVHSITLPTIDTDLPPGPGKLTLVSACTICHSPRYVTMQPNFSKKKWTEEVDKMKKVYGAPIQDEQVEPIVNYLVAIRGNGQ